VRPHAFERYPLDCGFEAETTSRVLTSQNDYEKNFQRCSLVNRKIVILQL